ncbi:FkbM family methyltransferase [Brevundimonas sp.]|uniref:FkbM family methyltransferase n=1 Tax=Brevundimonas sp. TaxID=1871086 RepID=UPI0025EA8B76|nr:FkbM family methyltransferase [Brevundimonas sp.]
MNRTFNELMPFLGTLGFNPKTVIDVGVAWGTPSMYQAFPEAYLVLVEALPYFEQHLKNVLAARHGEYHLTAVAAERGEAEFAIPEDTQALAGASLLYSQKGGELRYRVPIALLDDICDPERLEGPILLKTDAQSADLDVLRGAERLLNAVEVVVVEANVAGPVNLLPDIIAHMTSRNFRLFDLVDPVYRPSDQALGQLDACFVRRDSQLVAHRGWR